MFSWHKLRLGSILHVMNFRSLLTARKYISDFGTFSLLVDIRQNSYLLTE